MELKNKKILLGICGGIAAYKSADLVRKLKECGADVRVVLSQSAKEFITPLTLQALSGHPVADSLLDPNAEAAMGHIELARWAELVIIAPATANFIARLTAGMADELITTLCIATEAEVVICPAMNQQMYQHPVTQENLKTLALRGTKIWGPDCGSQACGEVGPGRLLEAVDITQRVITYFHHVSADKPLLGKRVMITAGPTREAIDPVRYISNHSSGKMGYALAVAARVLGAQVTIVSGPVALTCPSQIAKIDVESAEDMLKAVMTDIDKQDIFIGCAAVADYRIEQASSDKIKKSAEKMQLALTRNPDILATVSALPQRPFTVGFAAETSNVVDYARDKLKRKKLDMIAANDVSIADQGFNSDSNALQVIWDGGQHALPAMNKQILAHQLMSIIVENMSNK
ncbi:bifunctional phosphopantothenoylcysteine decarboxylase/phosphopantothenate--cysteine ligase CoaBC [Parashewanella spongiae]|uniref:bifunctional phosphopantothenoylcysteine decarboxylase/phosphopantothenate--cysteine ligase CoaBC n=1 Tax=Parashewanella spongiae TaxID=342950 RepID=UPI00140451F5|nr:bifunctional phosphopantothenoylcysteine decarboxylase/phosphopantothenate--cysteine ligase CoaBC [Parashewanella spongiae]MCL1077030.1 bifunctional phosphopantothenoylcysteine decarboxylase/phosphopantothenate--cysteine ligase CoaBC [Parashewanella spongiae]